MKHFKNNKASYTALALYLLIFSAFFISYPLNDALVENQDNIYYIAIFNYLQNSLNALFTGADYSQFYYPDTLPILNGEPAFGIFAIWSFIKLFIHDTIYLNFALIVVLFVLNSFSVYHFVLCFNKNASKITAFAAGVVFSFNMFILANIDNVNTIFFAPGILSMCVFSVIFLKQKTHIKHVFLFSFLIAFQLTCSIYNFLYLFIFYTVFLLVNFKKSLAYFKGLGFKNLLYYLPLLSFCLLYFYFVVFYPNKTDHWNFNVDLDSVQLFSMELRNFISVIPNSLYAAKSESSLFDSKSLFSGFAFMIILILGFKTFWKDSKGLLLIVLTCLVIGAGPYLVLGGQKIMMPLGYLFSFLDSYSYFRFPFRIFLLILLILSLLFSYGLNRIEHYFPKSKLIILLVVAVVVFENIPLKRTYLDFSPYQEEGKALAGLVNTPDINNILFLPAGDLIHRNEDPIIMNRTIYVFMYWQTQIQKNVLNGWSAFNPPHLLELNKALYDSRTPYHSLLDYCQKYEVDCVIHYTDSWAFDEFLFAQDSLKSVLAQGEIKYIIR